MVQKMGKPFDFKKIPDPHSVVKIISFVGVGFRPGTVENLEVIEIIGLI
jgi:hypothetical protein